MKAQNTNTDLVMSVSAVIKDLKANGMRYEDIMKILHCGRMTLHTWEHGVPKSKRNRRAVKPRQIYLEQLSALYKRRFGETITIME